MLGPVVPGEIRLGAPGFARPARCALLAVAPPPLCAAPKGFKFGVSSGDVSSNSAILWAKANKGGKASCRSRQRRFRPLRHRPKALEEARRPRRRRATTSPCRRRSPACEPGRKYKYRWCMAGGRVSAVGHFDTAPARRAGEDDPLRAHRRPGRLAAARHDDPVLEQLRGLEADQEREQQLQRADGRHDLLRHRGARGRRSPAPP